MKDSACAFPALPDVVLDVPLTDDVPPTDGSADLSLTPDQMTTWVLTALAHILDHEFGLAEADVVGDVTGQGLRAFLPDQPSRHGEDAATLLRTIFTDLVPRSYNTASPGHFGWIPAGGVFPAAVADLVAGAVNRYTGMYHAAPALVQLEADVLRWFCDWFDYPPTARGVFTSGGSMATFTAVACARAVRACHPDLAVIYTSTDAHLSVPKAARLAGFPEAAVRRVPVDEHRRMRPDALRAAIDEDRSAGRAPFMIVATAGTTPTGAVDPLHALADIAAAERLWLHVDAAYGGFFRLVPGMQTLLGGLSRADSLTVDPHKSLFLPYGTGAVLVRDGELLRRANAVTDSYLPAPPEPDEHYDPSQYGPTLSRGFPGLRVWLTLQSYGMERLAAALAEKLYLARLAATRLGAVPQLQLASEPQLSLFAFRLRLPGHTLEAENAATRELIRRVSSRGKTLITGCRLDGRDYARVCVLSFRTRRQHVEQLVADVTRTAQDIGADHGVNGQVWRGPRPPTTGL
jgi:aromatic-L-amino-acid decarboxylase